MHAKILAVLALAAGSGFCASIKSPQDLARDRKFPARPSSSRQTPLPVKKYLARTEYQGKAFNNTAILGLRFARRETPDESRKRPTKPHGIDRNVAPTPAPTGKSTPDTTVHALSNRDFALILPARDRELVSEAEHDGLAFCTPGSSLKTCPHTMPKDLIHAAQFYHDPQDRFVQVTGCLKKGKFPFRKDDEGGQMDVRYPNGAKCTFGGYAASFIQVVEPEQNRFCLRCCKKENDQENCNSHGDRNGCPSIISGAYKFPEVDCEH